MAPNMKQVHFKSNIPVKKHHASCVTLILIVPLFHHLLTKNNIFTAFRAKAQLINHIRIGFHHRHSAQAWVSTNANRNANYNENTVYT